MYSSQAKLLLFTAILVFLIVPETVFAQTCDGVITSRLAYGCESKITLGLADSDLTDPGDQPQITATVGSDTEIIDLFGSPPGSGFFSGFIFTNDSPGSSGDGTLNVSHGQTITFTYFDESYCGPPQTVTTVSVVDCVAPVITNVQPINITSSSVQITWNTNEQANTSVTYIPGGTITLENEYVLLHRLNIYELNPCTQYLFSVESMDIALNFTTDEVN